MLVFIGQFNKHQTTVAGKRQEQLNSTLARTASNAVEAVSFSDKGL